MTTELESKLFIQETPNFRAIHLYVKDDGAVKLSAQDMGPLVDDAWGDTDYEHWVEVQGKEVKQLVFALLKDKFQNKASAVDDFRAFCQVNGIAHEWDSW
jgi:hypothetical protein